MRSMNPLAVGARAGRRSRAAGLALALALALAAAPAWAAGTLSGVVNVNTASAEELQLLPGVGESRAQAIVSARAARGGFRKVDELVEVKGIGSVMLERLRPFVAVEGKTTARIR
ncbi:MAG TPA: helix-hairpin-helix domain-containing protein [Myxococcota bacterium]|nr:helix-hairpin-helix domain-containing protein [Myxococcota bacterium]